MADDSPQTDEVVGELRAALERATDLLMALEAKGAPAAAAGGEAAPEVDELQRRLDAAEADLGELSTRLVDTENQRGRLMNLYVATYQLHATLDVEEVTTTIAEIARDLVGAEKFVLLLREERGDGCEVAMAQGLNGNDAPFMA